LKAGRRISRRSFLAQVGGAASLLGVAGCTVAHDSDSVDFGSGPRGRGRPGTGVGNERWERERECTDGDSGRYGDAPGAGRRCRSDPGSRRRRH
jgi:hypothetical protein